MSKHAPSVAARPPLLADLLFWLTSSLVLLAGVWLMTGTALAAEAQASAPVAEPTPDPAALFATHCASCHGGDRLGGMGPALLPENLERLRPAEAVKTITGGRAATQMPAFGSTLSRAQIDAVARWIYTPVSPAPQWGEADIRASRVELFKPPAKAKPVFTADLLNLFVVVEGGDHHVSIVDGDSFKVLYRFASRYALHGGPKFSPDGRFVYFASRDGWLSKFDLWQLKVVAEVRAGINTRNAAVSGDGRYVIAANYLPQNLVLFDADLQLVKVIDARSQDGKQTSRVSAVYDAAPRHSFVAAMKDMPELWEISYDPAAKPIFDGYVHDYKMGEAIATPGFLNPRRTTLETVLDDFFFTQDYTAVMGTARTGEGQVVNLDVRRKIADLTLPGMPHLGSGITWQWQGKTVMASPNLKEGKVTVIDMSTWKTVKEIPTCGPGFFLRSHENSRYAFVDSMMSPGCKDNLQVIDKEKLEVVRELKPEPGKTLAHVEFTRDGRYALASLWEMDGAVIVFDAKTLQEVRRLPMSKPVGKYNVWNKTRRSEGTSH